VDRARRLLLESETQRESGEDKHEFAKEIKQDWLEFDLCSQWFECRMIPCAELGGSSIAPKKFINLLCFLVETTRRWLLPSYHGPSEPTCADATEHC